MDKFVGEGLADVLVCVSGGRHGDVNPPVIVAPGPLRDAGGSAVAVHGANDDGQSVRTPATEAELDTVDLAFELPHEGASLFVRQGVSLVAQSETGSEGLALLSVGGGLARDGFAQSFVGSVGAEGQGTIQVLHGLPRAVLLGVGEADEAEDVGVLRIPFEGGLQDFQRFAGARHVQVGLGAEYGHVAIVRRRVSFV